MAQALFGGLKAAACGLQLLGRRATSVGMYGQLYRQRYARAAIMPPPRSHIADARLQGRPIRQLRWEIALQTRGAGLTAWFGVAAAAAQDVPLITAWVASNMSASAAGGTCLCIGAQRNDAHNP